MRCLQTQNRSSISTHPTRISRSNHAAPRLIKQDTNTVRDEAICSTGAAAPASDAMSDAHNILLKLSTFRPTGPLSRRSGRLARIIPYSDQVYEQGAVAFLSDSTMRELLSIEQLAFIATAYVSANHKRSTTTTLLTQIGDLIASRLNSRAQVLSMQTDDSSSLTNALMRNNLSDGGRSLNLVSSSSIISSFARVGLKHLPLFTAVSFWMQGAVKFRAIRPKSKATMTWMAALLWSYSQVGLYDQWLWSEVSLLLQGDPVKWFKLMDADDCLKLIWAMVRVNHVTDTALIQLLSERASTQVGKLSMEELGSAWAIIADISRRSRRPPSDNLLMALSKASRVKVNSIKPSTLYLIFASIASLMEVCPSSDEGFWKQENGPPHSVSELLNDVALWTSNKASNFKHEQILGTLSAMSKMGYHNKWAMNGICRKLVMPRKLASSKMSQPPLIKLLNSEQLIILTQCLSSLDHYSSSLLSRILTRLQATDIPISSILKVLAYLVKLRHHDASFLAYTVKRLQSSNDVQELSEAAFLCSLIDNEGASTQLILDRLTSPGLSSSSHQETQIKVCWARSLLSSTTRTWDSKKTPSDTTFIEKLLYSHTAMERMAHMSSSDEGRGMSHLNLLVQDIERQVLKRSSIPQDSPSVSCYSFHRLEPHRELFADIAIPFSSKSEVKGLAFILHTELDFLRFWPGGEKDRDPSSRPLLPSSLLRTKMIESLGWRVMTINSMEWTEAIKAGKRSQFLSPLDLDLNRS